MLGLAVVAAFVLGDADFPSEAQIVAYAKSLPASRIDPKLGPEPFEAWLRRALGPHRKIEWSSDDCGETEGNPGSVPLCVSVDAHLRPSGVVLLSIGVGSSAEGIAGEPGLFFGEIRGLGPTETIDGLHLLPGKLRAARELHSRLSRLPDSPLNEDGFIRSIERLPAAQFSPGLGNTSLRDWIGAQAGTRGQVTTLVEGCGHHGPPVQLTGTQDEWAFVTAKIVDPAFEVLIRIKAGTCRRGAVGKPVATSVSIYDKRPGHIHIENASLETLGAKLASLRR